MPCSGVRRGRGAYRRDPRAGDDVPRTSDLIFFSFGKFAVNAAGQAVFEALIGPAGAFSPVNSLWSWSEDGGLKRIAAPGDSLPVRNGETRTVSLISFRGGAGQQGGFGSQLSDAGEVLFEASFDDDTAGIYKGSLGTDSPVAACAAGAVNAGCGDVENILLVNGSPGGDGRTFQVRPTEAFRVELNEPSSRRGDGQPSDSCIYAWLGAPDEDDVVPLPRGLGPMCFGPFLGATQAPRRIWNSIGIDGKLGADNAPGEVPRIPDEGSFALVSLPDGTGRAATVTFQGFVEDECSRATVPFSVTNGVAITITD